MFLDPTKFKEPPVENKPLTRVQQVVQQVLLNAAKYLETYGWVQGGFFGENGSPAHQRPACVWGAIGNVTGWQEVVTREAYMKLYVYIGGKEECGVPRWNDTPGRTKEQVVAALRGAAQCF